MVGPGIMAAGTSVAMVCTETNGGSARIVRACGYTWRSAKGHTSRIDYVLYDAFRVDEVKTCGIAHTVDLACGAAEDHRCVKCSIKVKGGTDVENNKRKKKKINIDTSSISKSVLVC